jgi:hypothetical protein
MTNDQFSLTWELGSLGLEKTPKIAKKCPFLGTPPLDWIGPFLDPIRGGVPPKWAIGLELGVPRRPVETNWRAPKTPFLMGSGVPGLVKYPQKVRKGQKWGQLSVAGGPKNRIFGLGQKNWLFYVDPSIGGPNGPETPKNGGPEQGFRDPDLGVQLEVFFDFFHGLAMKLSVLSIFSIFITFYWTFSIFCQLFQFFSYFFTFFAFLWKTSLF